MTTKQLNREYSKIMLKAEKAIGRKEGVSLLHKADSIRKKLYAKSKEYPQVDK